MNNAANSDENTVITYKRDYATIVITWDASLFECEVSTVGLTEQEETALYADVTILEGAGFPGFTCTIA